MIAKGTQNHPAPPRISFVVSSHGFGHAARACALMQALRRLLPELELRVYGGTPEWFFKKSVGAIDYRHLDTDVGLVQRSPLLEDIPATLERLAEFMPFRGERVENLARELRGQDLVVCDIAPLGLAAARSAGVPSVLVENFTWDWIYRAYLDQHPELAPYIDYLEQINRTVDIHIQTHPMCRPDPAARNAPPMARHLRRPREAVRRQLGIAVEQPLVLVSMGGVPAQYPFLERLQTREDCICLIPGAGETLQRRGGLLTLPGHSDFYHPDLVNACDALVCKVGYSTLAEARQCGVPMAWIPRERFPESPVLAAYIEAELHGLRLSPTDWDSGAWIDRLPDLLTLPRREPPPTDGAEQAARIILDSL